MKTSFRQIINKAVKDKRILIVPGAHDALSARLKAELNSGSNDIDIIQWTATFAGWLAPHMEDHEKLMAGTAAKHPDFDWDDFLPPIREMASYQGKLLGIPSTFQAFEVAMDKIHDFVSESAAVFNEQQAASVKMAAILQTTGHAAGFTSGQLREI